MNIELTNYTSHWFSSLVLGGAVVLGISTLSFHLIWGDPEAAEGGQIKDRSIDVFICIAASTGLLATGFGADTLVSWVAGIVAGVIFKAIWNWCYAKNSARSSCRSPR